jgi:head-tail adaptor
MPLNWKTGRLQAGKLRHRIDLVKVSSVQDSTGGINLSADVVYANRWASVEAIEGKETLSGESQMSVGTWQIVIRYIAGAPSWQALFQYPAGGLVQDTGGYLQKAAAPGGLSGSVAPTWDETEGKYTEDGNPSTGVTWLNLGPAPPYTVVSAALQVWWQGRQFQITSVLNPDGRNKMLALMCVEINDSRQQLNTGQPGDLN